MVCQRSRSLPLLTLPAIAAILLATLSGPASAQERGGKGLRGDRTGVLRVERSAKLLPQADAEVVLPRFEALFLSDGSVTLRGQGVARVDAPTSGFDFSVDLERGTYTTHRLSDAELEERIPLVESNGRNRVGEAPGAPELKVSPGNWQGKVRVQTKDPAFIVLTETTVQVSWSVATNGTVTWKSYSDGCWAANPSALGTHWFNSSCALGAAYYNSNRACNANTGSYYNYDFVDPNQGTFVTDSDWLCGRNDAQFDYSWSHNDSGEGAILIYGSVLLN